MLIVNCVAFVESYITLHYVLGIAAVTFEDSKQVSAEVLVGCLGRSIRFLMSSARWPHPTEPSSNAASRQFQDGWGSIIFSHACNIFQKHFIVVAFSDLITSSSVSSISNWNPSSNHLEFAPETKLQSFFRLPGTNSTVRVT